MSHRPLVCHLWEHSPTFCSMFLCVHHFPPLYQAPLLHCMLTHCPCSCTRLHLASKFSPPTAMCMCVCAGSPHCHPRGMQSAPHVAPVSSSPPHHSDSSSAIGVVPQCCIPLGWKQGNGSQSREVEPEDSVFFLLS